MTPAEVFEKLAFSPILQAIAGFMWFGVVLFIMFRAEMVKKKPNGTPHSQPPSWTPVPDHLAKLTDLSIELNTTQRTICAKLDNITRAANEIAGRVNTIAEVRQSQIDELITAIKEQGRMEPYHRGGWWR